MTTGSIKEQIVNLHRLMHCMMTPQPTQEGANPHNIKPLSARQILHRAKAAESMLNTLEKDIHKASSDSNYRGYEQELKKLKEIMTKALRISLLEAQSTTTPHPVETNHLERIYKPVSNMNTMANLDSDFLSDDDESPEEEKEGDEDEIILEDDILPEDSSEKPTSKRNAAVNMNSLKEQSPEEIQKEQAEAVQAELRHMVSQLKKTTSSMHTNLKTQNTTLLTQLEQQTSENLDKVGTVASDTANRVKKRRWARTAAKWGLLISCMVTFSVVFMIIRLIPRRKNACIFFGCERNNHKESKKTFQSYSSYSTREEEDERGRGRKQNSQSSRDRHQKHNDNRNTHYGGRKESKSETCRETDATTGQCVHFVLSPESHPTIWKVTEDSKQRRRLKSLNKAAHIPMDYQEFYATWWDHTEDMLRKKKLEKEAKLKREMEEAQRLHVWREEQKEKARKYEEEKRAKELEGRNVKELSSNDFSEDPSTYEEHMERKREFDRTKIREREQTKTMEVEVGVDSNTGQFNKFVNLETNEIEEPGCIVAARAEKQRLKESEGITDGTKISIDKQVDGEEAQWMTMLKKAEEERKLQDENTIDNKKEEDSDSSTEQTIDDDDKEEIDLFQEELDFMSFSAKGQFHKAIILLEKYPQLVNYMDGNGWFPIHEAARAGHVEILQMIIDAGFDINMRTNHGNGGSSLWFAQRGLNENHPAIVLLKEHGAISVAPS